MKFIPGYKINNNKNDGFMSIGKKITNPNKIPLQEIRSIIRSRLIDNGWFIAKDLHLQDIHFKNYNWDDEIDHQWHELESIEERTEAETQPRSIEDFLELITVKQ